MNIEILPVSIDHKKEVINKVRTKEIPKLINLNLSVEDVLQRLHKVGTNYAKSGTVEQDFQNEKFIAFYSGIEYAPHNRFELQELLEELTENGSNRFHPYGDNYYRGNYRILGSFAPNPYLADIIEEAEEEFTGAVPISTKDYQKGSDVIYYPPVFNINKLMGTICANFDNRYIHATSDKEIALTVADFYFWGLVMVHPYLGGNHRAFDRVIEYAFQKRGFQVFLPQSETLNIPNDDPFNIHLYSERKKLLNDNGLLGRDLSLSNQRQRQEWLEYQRRLNSIFYRCLNADCVDTKKVAEAILEWDRTTLS